MPIPFIRSGKSSEMSRRIRRHMIAHKRCVVIKYSKDLRYEGSAAAVVTHDNVSLPALPAASLAEVDNIAGNYDVIGIDEGQFYDDVAVYAEKWATEGKIVIVAALDGDFRRKPFGRVLELVPLAEDVVKLTAVCTMCGCNASFTKRTVADQSLELVGGAEAYQAVCRSCHAAGKESKNSVYASKATARAAVAAKRRPQMPTTPLTPLDTNRAIPRSGVGAHASPLAMEIATPSPRFMMR